MPSARHNIMVATARKNITGFLEKIAIVKDAAIRTIKKLSLVSIYFPSHTGGDSMSHSLITIGA